MNKVGIIQGRLSPRPFPKLQEFPWNTWEKEFEYAQKIGFDFIEWIFEEKNYKENPIWNNKGQKKIRKHIMETGITVESVCADYFLEKPFFRRNGYTVNQNVDILIELIKRMSEIEAKTILLPVLENAEIRCEEEESILTDVIYKVLPILEEYQIRIGFETELPIERYLELASKFNSIYVGAYYDTGNCAACGHDMLQDMQALKDYVIGVHVKDRLKAGKSVFLGTGDTNFEKGIPFLLKSGYLDNFVLQSYFEEDYIGAASMGLQYIKEIMRSV